MSSSSESAAVLDASPELVVLDEYSPSTPDKVVLVGQPNVGKSLVFSQLTSRYVTISNFPGTTVEVFRGRAVLNGKNIEILDTPGINSTDPSSEDERVTVAVLEEERPDLIIQIADAKNLRRALLLTAQLSQFGIPMLLALNMMDECREKGIHVDKDELSKILGIPVVETIATIGEGVEALQAQLLNPIPHKLDVPNPVEWCESVLNQVSWSEEEHREGLPLRTHLFSIASGLGAALHLENYVGDWFGWPTLVGQLEALFTGWGLHELMVQTLVVLFGWLAPVLVPVLWAVRSDPRFNERFGVWARSFASGSLILLVTISLTFQLVGNLGAQVFVELLEVNLFEAFVTPLLQSLIPAGFFSELLVGPYGLLSMGLAYGIAIVLPVVSTFFIAFSFLEDSGYLPRLSILSDRILRAMGLHGKAFLPMVLGLGCVTMATMTTRILSSKKERFIATLLLALGVPCSAQLGVVLGITSGLSIQALLLVFGTVALQLLIVGFALSKLFPGRRSSFILELPPIRCPIWRNILKKTYWRVVWFLKEALPLFVFGAFALFVLDKLQILGKITAAAEPVLTRFLGLPKETAAVFMMGFLRRDYGAAGLFDMARQGQLDSLQIVIGLVVLTLFVPCIANFFVMIKEQGSRNAILMVLFVFTYALGVGTVLNWLLRTSGIAL